MMKKKNRTLKDFKFKLFNVSVKSRKKKTLFQVQIFITICIHIRTTLSALKFSTYVKLYCYTTT